MGITTLPFGIIFVAAKYIWEKVEKPILEPILESSHDDYLARTRAGRFWNEIGNDLEFSMCLRSSLSAENSPSEIIIRNISNKKFYKVNLSVIAENDEDSYQQDITLYNVTDKYITHKLPEIPFNDLWVDEYHHLRTSFDYVYVLLDSVKLHSGETRTLKQESVRYRFFRNDWLNSEWIARWGRLWNANKIKHQKRRFRESCLYKLCHGENLLLISGGSDSRAYRASSIFDENKIRIGNLEWTSRSLLYSFLSNKSVSSFIFWTLLVLRLKNLDSDYQFQLDTDSE